MLLLTIWMYSLLVLHTSSFIIGNKSTNFSEARIFCQLSYGTDLATITTSAEHNETKAICGTVDQIGIHSVSRGCWIGLFQDLITLTWNWTDGTTLGYGFNADGSPNDESKDPWWPGEPNQHTSKEDCVNLYDEQQYNWNDIPCSYRNYPICNDPSSTSPTTDPTSAPTSNPTAAPIINPSMTPTKSPTIEPSTSPTDKPTTSPTNSPTVEPSKAPSSNPSFTPTTRKPSANPTGFPSMTPTVSPTTNEPSITPTKSPTDEPSTSPTIEPTINPTVPTMEPTNNPTIEPTTGEPSINPTTRSPTVPPTADLTTQEGEAGDVSYTTMNELVDSSSAFSSVDELPTTLIIVVAVFLCCFLFACIEFCVFYQKKKGKNMNKKGYQRPAAQMLDYALPSKQPALNIVPSQSAAKFSKLVSIPQDDEQYHEELGNMAEVNNDMLNDVVSHMVTAGGDEYNHDAKDEDEEEDPEEDQDDEFANLNPNPYANMKMEGGKYQSKDNGKQDVDKSSLSEHGEIICGFHCWYCWIDCRLNGWRCRRLICR